MGRSPSLSSLIARQMIDRLPVEAQRSLKRSLGRDVRRRISVADLDRELLKAADVFSTSEDDARALLETFELDLPTDRPPDPFSDRYREWTWELYRLISGRATYSSSNEASPFDLERAIQRPFPFQTGSATVVGDDLVARGHLLRCIGNSRSRLTPPARIVEFGPGWGNLTLDLVSTGFDVTAVEVDESFCTLTDERCSSPELLNVVHADMLDFVADDPYDAAIFFESFHHCSDHLGMLKNLHEIVRPDGPIFFASEPVQKMAYPWGPRLDGLSLWSTRTYGWLELGFDSHYFSRALQATGWKGRRFRSGVSQRRDDVIVALRDRSWNSSSAAI
ncbi:MAG: class I SAM-dependent methyltransferase [Acidimicrobiales bacterium]